DRLVDQRPAMSVARINLLRANQRGTHPKDSSDRLPGVAAAGTQALPSPSDVGQPVAVCVNPAGDGIEKTCLQLFGDRAALAGADAAVVKFPNRRDFGGGTGKKCLIGDIDFVTSNAFF